MSDFGAGGESGTPSFVVRLKRSLGRQWQLYLDMSVPHLIARWVVLGLLVLLYSVRVYFLAGFYIVTYGLGIYLLNLFIGFLSPLEEDLEGPILPSSDHDEFKPFIRRLPEFKFWYACAKSIVIAIFLTLFPMFDVPVFWPILLIYFIVLFILTMKRQIKHMIKHKYLPFSFGKKKYQPLSNPAAGSTNGIPTGAASTHSTPIAGYGFAPNSHMQHIHGKQVAEDIRTK